ncbi:cytochrome P450 [Cucurbitaria berberidis CBS 394.84]|uniref:Cytochrome P450 n=1 Tax=Cucurbitaria berberidis CBS 394.84 TaxID=1168544 RepID=A0A9P4L978_9PLEO|nr:cytochrome P450 [Cucurbitaria berberidis CBS 394.84]KAF1846876.1 cytochrome P450 [Cucurbitaria berberidis CBS 394.84]
MTSNVQPTQLPLTWIVIASCFILVVGFIRLYDPLRKFPGPLAAATTRLYSVKALWSGREHELLLGAHKRYGSVVRWQPNLLLLNDPTLLPIIYNHRSDKTPHYNSSLKSVESIVEAKSWKVHRNARKRISKPFLLESILQDEDLIDSNIVSWIDKLGQISASDKTFDFSRWPHLLGHDLNMIRLVGRPLSDMDPISAHLNNLVHAAQDGAIAVHTLARLPWLKKALFNGPLGRFLTPNSGDGSQLGEVLEFRDGLVRSERVAPDENSKARKRLLDHYMHEARNEDGTLIGSDEIEDDITNLLFAGTETVAHTILSTVLHISQNAPCLAKLQSEIKDAVTSSLKAGEIDHPNSPLPYTTVTKLPYLNACIREILRLDPPVVSYLPRAIKSGGIQLPNGQGFIPEGTEVAMSPYVIGRNEELYGPDAEGFRPSRFLEDSDWAGKVLPYDFAWGYGNRRCLGKVLAMLILRKSLFELFRHFEPEVVSEGTSKAYLLWSHKNVVLRLRRVEVDLM